MKTLNVKANLISLIYFVLFVVVVALFSSCQTSSNCPAYSSSKAKPVYKQTFLSDRARR